MPKKKPAKKTVKKPSKVQQKSSKTQKPSSTPIQFCEKCGSIMVPVKKGKTTYIKCRGCGKEQKKDIRNLKIVEETEKKKGVIVLEKNAPVLPLTDRECPKCEHNRAYWWMQQTRSADEPPTQFFRCEKCKHTWREYK